ncbi:MAG TPA: ParB/RepB/Spo0J family partition protein [Terriglobales bacterium]|nr:ParB/RepB/Spo0J family partition protein [Terriglobales bacterium]
MENMQTLDKVSGKRRALGRGLDSLLPPRPHVIAGTTGSGIAPVNVPPETSSVFSDQAISGTRPQTGEAVLRIALDQIDENPYQTRRVFDQKALDELAESIGSNGIVQPVVVRPLAAGRYTLILGERRCRAAKLAGETTIPAIIRQVSNEQAAEMTIVENLQRQDLNCLEQAHAFARLSREFGLTQEQIGQKTGCSRESVSNYMRLLKLPPEIQEFLTAGKLGFSEARVLLQLANPESIPQFAKEAVEKQLSVAQLTALVEYANLPGDSAPARANGKNWVDPNVRAIQSELEQILQCRVRISDRKGKGKILIEYGNLEDFDRVVEMLKGKA